MHVEELVVRQQRLLQQRAEGADHHGLGPGGSDGPPRLLPVHVLGLREVDAEQPAGLRHRGRSEPAPRPRGRSGRVTTSTGRWGVAASRSRTSAANSEVPR